MAFVTEAESILCEIGTEFLNIIHTSFILQTGEGTCDED
jgi:hypothetical protein